ncbi:hypothetical protein LTR16_000198 [Cryomyces antarcticus]|uniref:Uncharacterized protein n=1 Tax=Cryomyces antarcticus TaxID=329879 RepID=A0ABR0KV09_9PEZI|nr:hypothetical protein LTR39_000424 [Cryomyces antarcticus]KAK5021054.1 hypothetical protein LTR60_000133 [Cryomyces antarcticus]KAK5131977.1 hypothetical protein LTR16_000198 [Cryomyces antarcticus]
MRRYNGMFKAIMRLRVLCDRGTFHSKTTTRASGAYVANFDEALAAPQAGDGVTCEFCQADIASAETRGDTLYPKMTVLLMTTGTGVLGSPGYRPGVTVIRYIMKDTIEEVYTLDVKHCALEAILRDQEWQWALLHFAL